MTAPADLLFRLTERLGEKHVLKAPAEIAPHLREWRGLFHGNALAVVRPADTGDVAFVVAACADAGIAIVAQGGNTGLVGGGVPHGGIVLSLGRLSHIRAIDPLSASITVEAGVLLAEAQAAADQEGMLFPLSLPSEGSCTIGGNLATNAGGTGVLAYGNMRDLVLGLEVVLADGRVWNGLSALRKRQCGLRPETPVRWIRRDPWNHHRGCAEALSQAFVADSRLCGSFVAAFRSGLVRHA